jgi:hypothetical protein
MKKSLPLMLFAFFFFIYTNAQQDSSASTDSRKLVEMAEKQYISKDYDAALDNVNKALTSPDKTDDLLFLKIQILQKIYFKSNDLTVQLENTLQSFFKQVNQFTFPEDKYNEAANISSNLQQFKQSDKKFSDSVQANLNLQDLQKATALNNVIDNYLKANQNSYNKTYLAQAQSQIRQAVQHDEDVKKKIAKDSADRRWLKKAGRTGFSLSYAIPNSNIKAPAMSMKIPAFFNGTGEVPMGAKFAAGISFVDIIIPVVTTPKLRFSIDWNLLDAEYYQFDCSSSNADASTLHAIKAGTRIGPSVSIHITRKINTAVYYSARPGVQLLATKLYFTGDNDSSNAGGYLKPVPNFNLSNEFGAKIRLGKFTINPFYHFGTFMWKNNLYNNMDSKVQTLETNYKFSYFGIRLSI